MAHQPSCNDERFNGAIKMCIRDSPYIDKYWEFKGNPDYGMKINILPDGCTDFIFTLGDVADIAEQESLIMQQMCIRDSLQSASTGNLRNPHTLYH